MRLSSDLSILFPAVMALRKCTMIRPMRKDDYSKVYELWLSCKGMGLNDVDDSENGISRFLNRNPSTCFVAEIKGELIGAIMAGNDGRRGYIYHTAVHPSHQNRGIGSSLVNAVLEALKQQGISKTALVVFDRNKNGNAFWEKLGFTERNDLIYRNKSLVGMTRIET